MEQASEAVTVYDFSHPGLWIPAYLPLNWKPRRYKLLYGSRGRGATTNVAQVFAAKMLAGHVKGVMVRKVFEDIQGSQWDSFRQWAEEHDQADNFIFQKAPLEIICKPTGSRLISRGMNKPGRAKSVPGLSLAWYEEADELSAEDFRQTSLSIRGENIEEWLTFNSPSVDHWLLERFFPGNYDKSGRFEVDLSFEQPDGMFTWVPSTDPNAVIMHACYKHNPFNKPEFIEIQERDMDKAPESYRVSGLGLIGRTKTGMEFFPRFSEARQKRKIPYDPNLALHITFDFNTAPYMTLLIAQIRPKELGAWSVHFLQEICLPSPQSRTESVCKALVKELREGLYKGHRAGMFYYGDRTGKNSTPLATETVRHHFDIVWNTLYEWMGGTSDRVLRSNPPHTKAGDFINACFSGGIPIEITFDPSMYTTLRDLANLKQGADGEILKETVKDPETKVTYEKWGHCSQAMYYLVISAFRDMYREHSRIAA